MRSALLTATVALTALQLVAAQTFTACDPTKKTCPPDKALGKTVTVDFTNGKSDEFFLADGTSLTYGADGAEFTINKETDAPTISSNWYIFFGKVDVVMRAAPGVGIVSSFVMQSDTLDEIDWEWLGGDLTQVQTNYFGKGNTTTYDRATYVPVSSPQTTFHTYTIEWTAEATKWSIDGNLIRTLAYSEANGGKNYPQTPMQVKMGNWVGGSSTAPEGTVQWAGGKTNFDKAPFTMNVKSVTIQDYSTGGEQYVYSDLSGSWQSIKIGGSSSNSSDTESSSSSRSSSAALSSTISANSTATSSTISTVTSAPTASGSGLGAGAGTQSLTSVVKAPAAGATGASSTGSASTAKPSGSGGVVLKGGNYAVICLGLGLGYLLM